MSKWFYNKEQLEIMADGINRQFYPQRLVEMTPLDCYDLLEKLGLEVEWKYITPSLDVQGMFFVEEGECYVWPHGKLHNGDVPKMEKFQKNTIVINQNLLDRKIYRPKELFVCTHEIGHSIKDKDFFRAHPKNKIQMCSENSLNRCCWDETMSEEDVIESQNNYLTAALLMPREVIKRQFFKILKFRTIPFDPLAFKAYMKKAVAEIAKGFGVNYNPVLYRLCDIGVLDRETVPNSYDSYRKEK